MLFKSSDLTKKQVKKSCSLKLDRYLDRYLDRNSIYQDLRTKLDGSSTEVESVEIYKIRIFRFDFLGHAEIFV